MNIDVERLKVDREYWDSQDPSGGVATHYDLDDAGKRYAWILETRNKSFNWGGDGWEQWEKALGEGENMIPRPKPRSQEWDGEGLPPVGTVCEAMPDEDGWIKCTVIWHVKKPKDHWGPEYLHDAVIMSDETGPVYCSKFRPIRTQAERERDANKAALLQIMSHLPNAEADSIANDIIAAGWRKSQ